MMTETHTKKSVVKGRLALFATTLLWGTSFVVLKNTLDEVPTLCMLAIRFTGAALIMLVAGLRDLKRLDKDYLKSGAVMGLCLFFAYGFQTYGLLYTTPGKNAFLTATYCVTVPFLHWAMDKKRPGKHNLLAAFLCITGMGLVSLREDFSVGLGDALTAVCGLFYALHMIYTARFAKGRSVVLLSFVQFSVVAALSWLFSPLEGRMPTMTRESALAIAYLCVMCTAVCFFLQIYGQKVTPPSAAAVIMTLESVFGALGSVLFYHEALGVKMLLGFALIFVSVLVSELSPDLSQSPDPALP